MTEQTRSKSIANAKSKSWISRHRTLTIVLGIVGFFAVAGATSGNKTETQTSNVPTTSTSQTKSEKPVESKKLDVPTEYISALNQADSYANNMHMSKQGVYDQLVSQYGGKFSAESAQYAIDNIKTDWNANALASAKSYQKMNMSPAAIHDQLTSDYGAKFTPDEANYAIAHLSD